MDLTLANLSTGAHMYWTQHVNATSKKTSAGLAIVKACKNYYEYYTVVVLRVGGGNGILGKKSQKEEKAAGQATSNHPQPRSPR